MAELDVKKLIVIDESGFPLNLQQSYGRCAKKDRLKMPSPLHAVNVSVIGAINIEGIVDISLVNGNVDQLCIESFIRNSLLPNIKRGNIIILDNAPVHNIEKINKELLYPIGAMALGLPRYSPDFSPIELFWSKLKNIVRKMCPRTLGELYDAFVNAFVYFDKDDFRGWFEYCGYNT